MRETDYSSLNVVMRSLTQMLRYRKMFLCPLNITRIRPAADDGWNVSGVAPDVLENKALLALLRLGLSQRRIQRAVKRSGTKRGSTGGPGC